MSTWLRCGAIAARISRLVVEGGLGFGVERPARAARRVEPADHAEPQPLHPGPGDHGVVVGAHFCGGATNARPASAQKRVSASRKPRLAATPPATAIARGAEPIRRRNSFRPTRIRSSTTSTTAAWNEAQRPATSPGRNGAADSAASRTAVLNGVAVRPRLEDLIGADDGWEIVLAGDIAYEKDLASTVIDWLIALERRGASVLIGDPRRSYLPLDRLACVIEYSPAVTRELEDSEIKRTGGSAFGQAKLFRRQFDPCDGIILAPGII